MLKCLLAPAAFLYKMGVTFRHRLFDWGLLKSEKFDIPIICIGNITVGGTGKTPMAEMVIAYMSQMHRVALLSRGYGRRTKGYLEVNTDSHYRDVGDEPLQIKLKFPDTVVVVCEKRAEGIRRLRAEHPEVDLIITKDFEVNVILDEVHQPLLSSEPVVAVDAQHHLSGRKSLSIQELNGCSFITISPAESLGAYNRWFSCCHAGDFPPSIERYVDNYQALYFYLALEHHTAVLDRCDVLNAPSCIRAIPLEGFAPISTVAAWKRDNLNPCLSFFRQALKILASAEPNAPPCLSGRAEP